ncbi:glycosyltransferase family 8 protein [Candidatus Tisiphia endosymbiont of Sialis lutaria]|uniref:glycosyltransferase family 8 protein n=1 Tax=Candidatus Tisiphia endosymbiont of Sialis lutaria TaxID=2029164 RepID=UPI00312C9B25
MRKIVNKKLILQKYKYALALLIIILCILGGYSYDKIKIKKFSNDLVSLQNNDNIQNGKISVVERVSDYAYSRIYSNLRKNRFEFDMVVNDLNNNFLTDERKDYIEKVCLFQIEEAVDRVSIAKGYDCLSRLQLLKKEKAELYRGIKNSSYSLDLLYKSEYALNLAHIIIKDHKEQIFSFIKDLKEEDLLKYFSGYMQDEVAFLNKLIALNIPELSAKAFYRLSMINILGRSSVLEKANIDLKTAVANYQRALNLSGIDANNVTNIALVINDKYAVHAATTIASALLNSDLDSFYDFYFIMDQEDPISIESQEKLSSMQDIKPYKINFINVDNNLLPIELIKSKFKNCDWPLLISYRPFFSKILPNLTSVLSLDADLIVLKDLSYFKTIDMTDYFVAGSYDAGNPGHNELGCNHALPYFYINAGVMWFNLENMRNNKTEDCLVNSLNNTVCSLSMFEQDIINIAFNDRINHISHKWNHTPSYRSSITNTNYYTKFILHYSGTKPWAGGVEKAQIEQLDDIYKEYWRYRELTPWGTPYSPK